MPHPHLDSLPPAPEGALPATLAWAWALVGHRLRAMQLDGVAPRPDDPWPGLVVSPLVAEMRLAERPPAEPSVSAQALLELAARRVAEAAAMLAEAQTGESRAPIFALQRTFGLDDAAWVALVLALAAELDPDMAATLAWLQGSYEKRHPTPAFVADTIGDPALRLRIRAWFEPDGPLLARRLIELDTARPFESLLHRPFRLQARVVRFVNGDTAIPPEFATCFTLVEPEAPTHPLVIGAAEQAAWDRFRAFATRGAAELAHGLVAVMRGPEGVGRRRWFAEAARTAGWRLLVCDLPALARVQPQLDQAIAVALREATLQRAALFLKGWQELVDTVPNAAPDASPELARQRRHRDLVDVFGRAFATHPGLIGLGLETREQALPEFARGLEVFDVPLPSVPSRHALWLDALPPEMLASGLDPEQLAQRFGLTAGRIRLAVSEARESVRREGRSDVGADDLAAAIRQQVQTRMGGIATLRRSTETWDDLVTTPEVEMQLRELCHRYRFREQVMDGWGLRRRFASAFGLSALFEGPPGTGKTMSAGLVAAELGLDLYQVDLSQIVSKWVGETEKNLSKVFDEAERSGAMLLFDEADSLFSKRTSVSSANDRYANLEVNYLLQRVERFTGVAVLTTNFSESIDTAFARRLSMRVTFTAPGIPERTRLWESMLNQPGLPMGRWDAEGLATEFDFAGGLIRNAVLRAAFFAASRGILIDDALLRLSARIEMKEKGLLIRGNPHEELTALLTGRGSGGKRATPPRRPGSMR